MTAGLSQIHQLWIGDTSVPENWPEMERASRYPIGARTELVEP